MTKNILKFGTAGAPISSKKKDPLSASLKVLELGLDGMELEFVRGIRWSNDFLLNISEDLKKLPIFLTCHAPFFINLNGEQEIIEASRKRIFDSLMAGEICGAKSVTFHAGYYLKQDEKIVYEKIKNELIIIKNMMEEKNLAVKLAPETTGKATQFGSIDELISLSKEININFCLDISHIHARTNVVNTKHEFEEIILKIKNTLGDKFLENMHFHLSGIKYSKKGELSHLVLKESDFNYKDFLQTLKEHNVGGYLICESPNIEEDALVLKNYYHSL